MEETVIPVIAILTTFGSTFGILYVYLTTRNRERMALIDKGMDAKLLVGERQKPRYDGALKFGMLGIAFSLGLLMGHVLEDNFRMDEELAYFSMLFLFGGLSLILYYWLMRRREHNQD